MSETLTNWMAWEGGVDLLAVTDAALDQPNVILHLARMVHTPVGSAPGGIVFWQPDPAAAPEVVGFVCSDEMVGAYFGPKIFAGTPFGNAPVLKADFEFEIGADSARAKVSVADHVFETRMSGLGALQPINRSPIATAPFFQQGAEALPTDVQLTVNGKSIQIIVPPAGITGGPAAVFAPFGSYAR
jgi:hypothetical protein